MHVPGELLHAGAEAVADAGGWSPASQSVLIGASLAARYRRHAEKIARAWARSPDVEGAAVASAMKAAASKREPCGPSTK